jgi:uncharacterized protein (TIGR03437 family)
MHRALSLTAFLIGWLTLFCPVSADADVSITAGFPLYTAAGVVNAATQLNEALAPNVIATLYGTNLSFVTHGLTAADLDNGDLPISLGGVSVRVNGLNANMFYVSPLQINFLIPYELNTTSANITVVRNGAIGPVITVPMAATSPAFFQWSGNLAIAEHVDGTLVSASSPASANEIIVLFAAGLGRTSPDTSSGALANGALQLYNRAELQITLNGTPVPTASILYAGVAPGFAGLYQINLRLPPGTSSNPEIRIIMGSQMSPPAIQIPVQ